jgi:ribosomal protein L23
MYYITLRVWTFMKLKINWEHKRVKHAIERMWLRGVSVKDVEEAVKKGKKVFQRQTGLTEAFFRRFSVVYDEKVYGSLSFRKIFPVTVKIL